MALYEGSGLGRPHPKPRVVGKHWLDSDLAPFLIDDYETDKQSPEAQVLLDLAEMLADARRMFALAGVRDEQRRQGTSARGESLYVPEVYKASVPRRGYSASRE